MQTNLHHLFNSLRPVHLEQIRGALVDAITEYSKEIVVDGKVDTLKADHPSQVHIVSMANISLAIDAIDASM